MKKFNFTLGSLLRIKYSLEKQVKQQLSTVLIERNKCVDSINSIDKTKEVAKREFNYVSPYEYQVFFRYYNSLELKKKEMMELLNKLEEELEKIRNELLKITEEKKVLERLKAKQYEEYLLECKKEQDKIIDDMLSYKLTLV